MRSVMLYIVCRQCSWVQVNTQEVGKTGEIKSERVTVTEAARLLGMSKQGVREHMKRNLFAVPIGEVTKQSENRYQYHIYRSMLDRHLGRTEACRGQEG